MKCIILSCFYDELTVLVSEGFHKRHLCVPRGALQVVLPVCMQVLLVLIAVVLALC